MQIYNVFYSSIVDGVRVTESAALAKLRENKMLILSGITGFCFTTKKPNLKEETQLCLVIQVQHGNYHVVLVSH